MSASREKQLRQEQAASGYVDPKTLEEQARQKKEKRSNRLYALIGVVFLVAVVISIVWRSNIIAKKATAVTIDGEKYTAAEVEFYYWNSYNNFMNDYYYIASYLGLSSGASLKSQTMSDSAAGMLGAETGSTWHDYFLEQATQQMAAMQSLEKQAAAEGYTYSDSVQTQYDSTLESLKTTAAANGYSLKDYLSTAYGSLMTEKVFTEQLMRVVKYSDYVTAYVNSLEYTDAEIEDAYKADKNSYDRVSYASVSVLGSAQSTTDANGNTVEPTEEEQAAAKEAAKALAEQMLADYKAGKDLETVANENDKTYSSVEEGTYSSSELGEWLFDSARKSGDCAVIESGTTYYVAVFNERFRKDEPTVNVRHILFQTATGEKAEGDEGYEEEQAQLKADAYAKAQAMLEEWKAGDATEESFAALATANTEDTGSQSTGGLYENVYVGQMVDEFEDWCFDSSRKAGDTGIVETSYGAHVMYFVSKGMPYWQYEVVTDLKNADYSEWISAAPADCEIINESGMNYVG